MSSDTHIAGMFYGFKPGALFKLGDGNFWLQTGHQVERHHAVDPQASVLDLDDGEFLTVAGIDVMVPVRRLEQVVESRIRGRFTGWTGKSIYQLTNGQTWQQAKFLTKYVVKYMPAVLIYHVPAHSPTHSDTNPPAHAQGTTLMQVAGTTVIVRQIG